MFLISQRFVGLSTTFVSRRVVKRVTKSGLGKGEEKGKLHEMMDMF